MLATCHLAEASLLAGLWRLGLQLGKLLPKLVVSDGELIVLLDDLVVFFDQIVVVAEDFAALRLSEVHVQVGIEDSFQALTKGLLLISQLCFQVQDLHGLLLVFSNLQSELLLQMEELHLVVL